MFLYRIPALLLLVIAVVAAVLVAVRGQIVVDRHLKRIDFMRKNEDAGFIIAVVGTLYAVIVGFTAVTVWQQYDVARSLVALETSSVANTWHLAAALPQRQSDVVRTDMIDYVHLMINEEWPRMRTADMSPNAGMTIMRAIETVARIDPGTNMRVANGQASTFKLLSDLHDARERRLATNEGGVSPFEWVVLTIGAVVVIASCYLFSAANMRPLLVLTSAVTIVIASTFVLIFELQYPFRSDVGVKADDWVRLDKHIVSMEGSHGLASMRRSSTAAPGAMQMTMPSTREPGY